MNKKALYLIVVLFISVKLFAQTDNSSQLVKAEATSKAMSFLNLIPEGREKSYGFNNRNDFSRIVIEEPYQTYSITEKNHQLIFVPENSRVPISVDGNYVALLTVQFANGKVEVVDFGGNILAKKLQEFEKLYFNDASRRVILRNTYLNSDYLTKNFSALCFQNENRDINILDPNSPEPVYLVNESVPVKTTLADFFKQTIEIISNSNIKK